MSRALKTTLAPQHAPLAPATFIELVGPPLFLEAFSTFKYAGAMATVKHACARYPASVKPVFIELCLATHIEYTVCAWHQCCSSTALTCKIDLIVHHVGNVLWAISAKWEKVNNLYGWCAHAANWAIRNEQSLKHE
ncbi:unnamed protein product [Protopolystoma xenopodis]|uniref:Uncharacterized protein n=1 Tax=Protopolystoma xenopodis TaxID=117903 RepID=A0A448XHH2_9PLAT|nr:unnamed protein product [Protopolystoma xenopodis]